MAGWFKRYNDDGGDSDGAEDGFCSMDVDGKIVLVVVVIVGLADEIVCVSIRLLSSFLSTCCLSCCCCSSC